MSRIAIPAIESATGATADVYNQLRKIAGGTVPNLFAALGHLAPNRPAGALQVQHEPDRRVALRVACRLPGVDRAKRIGLQTDHFAQHVMRCNAVVASGLRAEAWRLEAPRIKRLPTEVGRTGVTHY